MKQMLLLYSAVYSNRMTTHCVEELTPHMLKHRSVWFVVQWPSTAVGQE